MGFPTRYCWSGALGLLSDGLGAAQLSHLLQSFSTVCWRPGQKKAKAILFLVFWTPMWPPVLCSWRCWNTSCRLSSGTRSWSLVLPVVSGYDLLNSTPPCISRRSHCVHKLLKESERCDMSFHGGWPGPSSFLVNSGSITGSLSWLSRMSQVRHRLSSCGGSDGRGACVIRQCRWHVLWIAWPASAVLGSVGRWSCRWLSWNEAWSSVEWASSTRSSNSSCCSIACWWEHDVQGFRDSASALLWLLSSLCFTVRWYVWMRSNHLAVCPVGALRLFIHDAAALSILRITSLP